MPFIISGATDEVVSVVKTGANPSGHVATIMWFAVALLVADLANTAISNIGGYIGDVTAVRLRRMMVVLVDAGRGPSGNWVQTVDGPSGSELIMAAADTAGQASVNASYTAFQAVLSDWQRQLQTWRCGLSPELRKRYGVPANWNCRDIKLSLTRVGFDQLGPERSKVLNAVDTRLTLPAREVDTVIAAGRDALVVNPVYLEFLKSVGGRPGKPAPSPMPSEPPAPAESAPVAIFPGLPEIAPASSFAGAQ